MDETGNLSAGLLGSFRAYNTPLIGPTSALGALVNH